jgi:uncharacterized protein
MKKLVFLLFLIASVTAFSQNVPPRPNPPRLVNDLAHVLTADQAQALENKLVAYDDSTSTQIVIVTVPTVGDRGIEDFALQILRTWGVGNKEKNNGIVIVASIDDHKIRIETGYGMEGAIPDITANQIIQSEIVPAFREGNYYRGFDQATDAIFRAAAGEYKAPEDYNRRNKVISKGTGFPFLIIIIILIIIFSRRGGGGRGGMMSRRGFNPLLGGLLGGFLGSRAGGWSGGGGGGGGWSGGGGGFGGFGGGGGGGGGASGSW